MLDACGSGGMPTNPGPPSTCRLKLCMEPNTRHLLPESTARLTTATTSSTERGWKTSLALNLTFLAQLASVRSAISDCQDEDDGNDTRPQETDSRCDQLSFRVLSHTTTSYDNARQTSARLTNSSLPAHACFIRPVASTPQTSN